MADRQVSQRRPDTEEQQERNVVIDREAQQRALAEEREKQRREEIVRLVDIQNLNIHFYLSFEQMLSLKIKYFSV